MTTTLPAGAVSGVRADPLGDWALLSTEAGAITEPASLPDDRSWRPAPVPGTVAMAVGPDGIDGHEAYDASDWWYRTTFAAPEGEPHLVRLRFDGLATLATVWLNGELLLESSNMFVAHAVEVTDRLGAENELVVRFHSLDAALAERRPRPRWKTRLVEHQQLRWHRTTLLGRIPGWTPAMAPVGPWRGVWLEVADPFDVAVTILRPSAVDGVARLELEATVRDLTGASELESARVVCGGVELAAAVEATDDGWRIALSESLPSLALWWPHTHGEPALHDCTLELAGGGVVTVDCGRLGFRAVEVDRTDGAITFRVNGTELFCRGACWTTTDARSLGGSEEATRSALRLAAEGNANMLRVGGTMVYESDAFYDACDELGILVWQDFMFANMDYPADDDAFRSSIDAEVAQQLDRLQRHACVAAFCGGSEVEQQAAMFGADRSIWTHRFFSEALPEAVEARLPGIPYWTSTPTGGTLPFHVGEGLTHYYGVGAYKRAVSDVRLAGVRFTPECLGFSHVPDADNLRQLTPGGSVSPHDPAWKRGVPRDSGAGWDFEDVRDHYLAERYEVDPVRLRSEELERYLTLSRLVTGEVMERVYDEWRAEGSGCGGGLVWFYNDLRPGAGWGLLDSDRSPKAAYYHLRRAWAPRAVRLLDRGLDGLVALALNESAEPLQATLELLVIARGSVTVGEASRDLLVPARGSTSVVVEEALGHFVDPTYSYRFGPPRHELVVARLVVDGGLLSEDVYRPIPSAMTPAGEADCTVEVDGDGLLVTISAPSTLYGVTVEVRDHRPDDAYFTVTPGRPRSVRLRRTGDSGKSFKGFVEAANITDPVRLAAP